MKGVLLHTLLCFFDFPLPPRIVGYHFFHCKVHPREDVGNAFEQRSREDVYEANLRLSEFDQVVANRRAAE
jgi:hypothetical protein